MTSDKEVVPRAGFTALDIQREELREKLGCAWTLATSLEVQVRLAGDVDDELETLLAAAHGRALTVMIRLRAALKALPQGSK